MKKDSKRFKVVALTYQDVEKGNVEGILNTAADEIEKQGGTVVGIASPVTMGMSPQRLIYTIVYTQKEKESENNEEAGNALGS